MHGKHAGPGMTDNPNSPDEPNAARPRKRPTVIEGEAKDVTPQQQAHEKIQEKAEEKPQPKAEAKSEAKAEPQPERERAPAAAVPPKTSAGSLPQIAGAAILFLMAGAGGWFANSYFSAPAAPAAPVTVTSPPADTQALAALKEEIARLSARLEKQETPKPPADNTAANERTSKLELSLAELRKELSEWRRSLDTKPQSEAEFEALQNRLLGIEQKITSLTEKPKEEVQASAGIAALGALRDALASGAPFARELELVRTLLKERAAPLAALDTYAAKGLPTVAQLARQFEALAGQLAQSPQPEGGIVQRLWNNAGRLIEVRPVGEPKGNQPGAIVARMETKLARGDLVGALEESKALPAASRDLAKDWFAQAERRRDAEVAVKTLLDVVLAAASAERKK